MESNRDEANRCIELSKLCIKRKDLDKALKFSIKADKLFPTSETKCLIGKLQSLLEKPKRQSTKLNQSVSADSDASHSSVCSDSSSGNKCNKRTQNTKHQKKKMKRSNTTYSFKMKEINKDESQKCLEKAEKYIHNKQFDLAEKFLLKSKKLFPLSEADELLKKLQEIHELNKPKYTEAQSNIVKKVKNSENYYVMLDINVTANIAEIKRAYKKLALLLHPDKNSAPGSGEMFKVLSNAMDTLCDHKKRYNYDQTLKKPTTSASSQSSSRQHFSEPSHSSRPNYTRRNSNYYQSPCDYEEQYEHYDIDTDEFYDSDEYLVSDYFDSYDYPDY